MTRNGAKPIRLGISSCLLGNEVRFDGGHKKDEFLTRQFSRYVEWVPMCPEMEIGLGVPRESLRLVAMNEQIRLVAPRSGLDHTEKMQRWTRALTSSLVESGICGFVLKKDSPSCGLDRVRVYHDKGLLHRKGQGLFASGLADRFPGLPMEEEGRLNDPRLRENFVSQVFAYRRWLDLLQDGLTRARIQRFHAQHKFLLLAHEQVGSRELGNLLGRSDRTLSLDQLGRAYFTKFSQVMRRTPTRRNHMNVLQHLTGYFSPRLSVGDRTELTEILHAYHQDRLPLIVPVTLIRHYVRKLEVEYLQDQFYLDPHPDELRLLNQL